MDDLENALVEALEQRVAKLEKENSDLKQLVDMYKTQQELDRTYREGY